jgi:hypothetical protein
MQHVCIQNAVKRFVLLFGAFRRLVGLCIAYGGNEGLAEARGFSHSVLNEPRPHGDSG